MAASNKNKFRLFAFLKEHTDFIAKIVIPIIGMLAAGFWVIFTYFMSGNSNQTANTFKMENSIVTGNLNNIQVYGDLIVNVDPKKLMDSIKTGIELRKELLSDSSLSEEQRVYLNAELLVLQEKLANFPETISERVTQLLSSIKGLESLHETLPESQIKTAQIALTKNNTEEAIKLLAKASRSKSPTDSTNKENRAKYHFQLGRIFEGEFDYQNALKQYKEALSIDAKKSLYIAAYTRIARILGKYSEAQKLLDSLGFLPKEEKDPSQSEDIPVLNELAQLYRALGLEKEAEVLYDKASEIQIEHEFDRESCNEQYFLGRAYEVCSDYYVGEIFNNLGVLYTGWKHHLTRAEELLTIAKHKRTKLFTNGDKLNSYKLAETLNNLGMVFTKQKRFTEAESAYIKALELWSDICGQCAHPDRAIILNNLGYLYEDIGLLARHDANQFSESKFFHDKNGDVQLEINSLFQKAEYFYKQALQMFADSVRETNHPAAAGVHNNLAALYQHQGHFIESEIHYKIALRIRREKLGPRHILLAETKVNYAVLLFKDGRDEEAYALSKCAAMIAEPQASFSSKAHQIFMRSTQVINQIQEDYPENIDKRFADYASCAQ